MPLGLMPGMPYEEKETVLEPGDSLLLHSDGIVEAHDPQREMFGFPRLKQAVADYPGGGELIDRVLADLQAHTGPDAEQEDDITMVTLQRSAGAAHVGNGVVPEVLLAEFEVRERRGQRAPGDRPRGRRPSTASACPASGWSASRPRSARRR